MQMILKFIYHYLPVLQMLIDRYNNLEIVLMKFVTGWLRVDWSWMLVIQSFLLLAHRDNIKTLLHKNYVFNAVETN